MVAWNPSSTCEISGFTSSNTSLCVWWMSKTRSKPNWRASLPQLVNLSRTTMALAWLLTSIRLHRLLYYVRIGGLHRTSTRIRVVCVGYMLIYSYLCFCQLVIIRCKTNHKKKRNNTWKKTFMKRSQHCFLNVETLTHVNFNYYLSLHQSSENNKYFSKKFNYLQKSCNSYSRKS